MGWIKLFRKVFDNFLYFCEPFDKFHAWIDLILLAQHDDETFMSKGQMVTLKRGQLFIGRKYLSKRWKWSENKVLRFLGVLTAQGMVTTNGTPNGTTLTIVNYGKYQDWQTTNGTTESTTDGTSDGTTDGTHTRSIRSIKNIYPQKKSWDDVLKEFCQEGE